MSLKFSSEKKRVFCDGCRQFQPVLIKTVDGQEAVVCSACLSTVSQKPEDVDEAMSAGVVRGRLDADNRLTKGPLPTSKPLPKPATETRPASNEGTR